MTGRADFIDLHSHLLPGVDDGCRTWEDSIVCVRRLMEHGFTGTICTPHMAIADFSANVPSRIVRLVETLQERLRAAGLDFRLWAGGELRIGDETIIWMRRHGVPTLGSSRSVLLDFWGSRWPACGDAVLDYLLQEGYEPILAHPERMDLDDRQWNEVLDRLQRAGVLLQGNLRCIARREGERVAERAGRLLRENRYQMVATDLHGPLDLDDRLAGLAIVQEDVGAEKLVELLAERPRQILGFR